MSHSKSTRMRTDFEAALTQPTVCALTAFNTLNDALQVVPDKHVPFVMLRAQHGQVSCASGLELELGDIMMVLLNARTLKLRVFVWCDGLTALIPQHRSCVSHIVCAPPGCAAVVPMRSDLLWMDFTTMQFAFVTLAPPLSCNLGSDRWPVQVSRRRAPLLVLHAGSSPSSSSVAGGMSVSPTRASLMSCCKRLAVGTALTAATKLGTRRSTAVSWAWAAPSTTIQGRYIPCCVM